MHDSPTLQGTGDAPGTCPLCHGNRIAKTPPGGGRYDWDCLTCGHNWTPPVTPSGGAGGGEPNIAAAWQAISGALNGLSSGPDLHAAVEALKFLRSQLETAQRVADEMTENSVGLTQLVQELQARAARTELTAVTEPEGTRSTYTHDTAVYEAVSNVLSGDLLRRVLDAARGATMSAAFMDGLKLVQLVNGIAQQLAVEPGFLRAAQATPATLDSVSGDSNAT